MADPLKTFLEGAVAPPLPQDGQLPFYPLQRFALDGIQPPSWLWVNEDDVLQLQTRNSVTGVSLQVAARLLEVNGRITTPQFLQTPASDGTIVTTTVKLYQGYMLGATVTVTGAILPIRGQTYCVLKLLRMPSPSSMTHLLLGADYVTSTFGLQWPYGRTQSSVEGQGSIRSESVANPAAGADWTYGMAANRRGRIRGATATLVTSATIATRQVAIIVDDGVNTLFTVEAAATQAQSATVVYNLLPTDTLTALISTQQPVFIPPDLVVAAGYRLRSSTGAIQAGDQWSAIRLLTETWQED